MHTSWLTIFHRPVLGPVRLFVAGLMLLLAHTASAQGGYQIEVAVADKSAAEQKQAYQVALRRVLLTNSGDKTLLNRNDVRAGINQAELYVDSFSYRSPAAGTVISRATPITDTVRRTGEAAQLMMIEFNPAKVQELISSKQTKNNDEEDAAPAGLASINSALMWILVEDGRSELLVGGDVGASVMKRAREIAGGNGIRLTFPSGDDADLQALTSDQLRAQDVAAINAAAARYSAPAVTTAYFFRKRSRGWLGMWSKVAGEEAEHQEFEAQTLDDMLMQGIAWLNPSSTGGASEYQYGGDAAAHTEGLVWVSSGGSPASYSKSMAYFNSLGSVASVFPKVIGPDGTLFAIMPRTALTDIANSAQSLAWLRRAAPPVGDDTASQAELAFDFVP